ncbi:MAG: RNA polymerase sigma factor [Pseudomonadota bacterium]
MPTLSDDQLVALAQATGDRDAFNELFARYQGKLHSYLLGRIDRSVVDDVVQETYLKAFINIGRFAGKSAFSTWLFSIAINECRQQARKIGIYLRLTLLFSQNAEEPSDDLPLDLALDFERQARALSPMQYDVFVLGNVYGFSQREIAKHRNIPLGTVKSYLAQAKTLLKSEDNP